MSKYNTGGPAYPCDSVSTGDQGRRPQLYSGMTLRDYFAAKAMQALIVAPINEWPATDTGDSVSSAAYEIADAMLEERSK